MSKVENLLDYIPVEERLLNCTECVFPWVEMLPVKASPKALKITCPWCGIADFVTTYVPRRLR